MSDFEVWITETCLPCEIPRNNTIFVFDEQVGGTWAKWQGINASRFVTLDPAFDDGQLLAGDSNSAIVNQLLSGASDGGSDITGRWQTKWHDGGSPEAVKLWRHLFIHTDKLGPPLTVTWEVDGIVSGSFTAAYRAKYTYNSKYVYNSTGVQPQGAFYDSGSTGVLAYGLPQIRGRRMRLTFSESSRATPFRILGYELMYRRLKQRYPARSVSGGS